MEFPKNFRFKLWEVKILLQENPVELYIRLDWTHAGTPGQVTAPTISSSRNMRRISGEILEGAIAKSQMDFAIIPGQELRDLLGQYGKNKKFLYCLVRGEMLILSFRPLTPVPPKRRTRTKTRTKTRTRTRTKT